tara:strand:- start:1118 stop:1510 length:393 start_codon:yes stop_codon:yes gene_type:complete
MELPTINIPDAFVIQTPSLPLPTANIPSYQPLFVPPSDLKPPEGVQAETTATTEQPPPPSLNIPIINFEVPLPTTDTVVVAGYAAVSAVAVTTFAQPFFDAIKKKIQKLIQGKIDKWKQNNQKRKDSLQS